MPHISVVIPLYKCSLFINELGRRLINTLPSISEDFEIIFVNDASPENDWEIVVELSKKDKRIKGINLSRNFGQHYAITAGLDNAKGEWVVVMDGDLQDQPEEINKLYDKATEGYDVVFAKRIFRMDKPLKKLMSKLFYKIFDYFTDNTSDNLIANFGIFNKRVISNFILLRENNRCFPLFIKWMGFNTTYVDIKHSSRKNGKSSYNFRKLINLAIDIIVSHSNKPLKLSIKFGFILSVFALVYLLYLIIRSFYLDVPLGWTSIMAAIFFIGGLIFANLGLIGIYIGKIFNEVKNRPLFIVKDKIGFN